MGTRVVLGDGGSLHPGQMHRAGPSPGMTAIAFIVGAGAQESLELSGAVPKLTLKRLHQIVTERYLSRSTPAGTS